MSATATVIIFAAMSVWFFLLLGIQRTTRIKFCAICLTISSTWVVLLILNMLRIFQDTVLTALFIGQSITGVYYLLEKKLATKYNLFRLPFLMSGTAIMYFVLTPTTKILSIFLFLVLLWGIFGMIFISRNNQHMKKLVERIIACCKNW